jgi:hypothetical protein
LVDILVAWVGGAVSVLGQMGICARIGGGQLAALLLCTFSLCESGSIAMPKKYSLKDGRVYSSTSFGHFKAVYAANASSTVHIVVCESFTEYENASLKADLSFKKLNSSTLNASFEEANHKDTGFLTQSTDVSKKVRTNQKKINGSKRKRTNNRPNNEKTDDTSAKNSVNSKSSSKQQPSDDFEIQSSRDTEATASQSKHPEVLKQLQWKTKQSNDRLKCRNLTEKRTSALGINYRACKNFLIKKQCNSPFTGVYSISLKGIGNFDILAATHVAEAN